MGEKNVYIEEWLNGGKTVYNVMSVIDRIGLLSEMWNLLDFSLQTATNII